MQISIGNLAITGTIPAEQVIDFKCVPEIKIQQSPALNARDITLFLPSPNKKLTITFAIKRVQASPEAAAFFTLSHEAQFPIQDTLHYVTDAGELTIQGAVAVVTACDFEGYTTTHSYRIVCGGSSVGSGGGVFGFGVGSGSGGGVGVAL